MTFRDIKSTEIYAILSAEVALEARRTDSVHVGQWWLWTLAIEQSALAPPAEERPPEAQPASRSTE
mgnify:CR=1 FL=1